MPIAARRMPCCPGIMMQRAMRLFAAWMRTAHLPRAQARAVMRAGTGMTITTPYFFTVWMCIGQVPQGMRMAALALGLGTRDRLLHIELPLALPVILAGVKTAAVMSVGTATIAAFIGAGGYGERIAMGLALNDNDMLLAGAIPAAVLALATQLAFDFLEWRLGAPARAARHVTARHKN